MLRKLRKGCFLFLIISLVVGGVSSGGWAQADPIADEWNMWDVLVARPIGVAAGIIGTGVFIVSLPFTVPTKSVDTAAQMFIVEPFKFSFVRPFPDEDVFLQGY
jgi:hypothetical protein